MEIRTANKYPACPVETTLTLIGSKWIVLIFRELFTGTKRFSDLKNALNGVSQKMLTQQLRQMEKNGLINRKVYPVVPPKVEYSLTDLGKTFKPVLSSIEQWGKYIQKNG